MANESNTFQSLLTTTSPATGVRYDRPKPTCNARIVNQLIRSEGPVIGITKFTNNLNGLSAALVTGMQCIGSFQWRTSIQFNVVLIYIIVTSIVTSAELKKLEDAGYGQLVDRKQIATAKVMAQGKALNVFLKPHYANMDMSFFELRSDKRCDWSEYKYNYDLKPLDETTKLIVQTFHKDKDYIIPKPYVNNGPKIVTALDVMDKANAAEGIEFNILWLTINVGNNICFNLKILQCNL